MNDFYTHVHYNQIGQEEQDFPGGEEGREEYFLREKGDVDIFICKFNLDRNYINVLLDFGKGF